MSAELSLSQNRAHWILPALLVLFLHALFFRAHVNWGVPTTPPRLEVNQIDPQKLEAIRKKWQSTQPKGLLLDKDKNRPSAAEPPKNAQYLSDKNIEVEKEQRARNTQVIPKPGAPGADQSAQTKQETSRPRAQSEPLPLGKLGLPLKLTAPKKASREPPAKKARQAGQNGGNQYVGDKKLPEGGETLLNAQESVFYSFYSRLYETIGPLWQSEVNSAPSRQLVKPGEYTTSIDLVLNAEGRLLEVRRVKSSGIPDFDAAVDTAWRKIGNFPNPPKGLLNDRGEVHTGWTFTVQVGESALFQMLPPERVY